MCIRDRVPGPAAVAAAEHTCFAVGVLGDDEGFADGREHASGSARIGAHHDPGLARVVGSTDFTAVAEDPCILLTDRGDRERGAAGIDFAVRGNHDAFTTSGKAPEIGALGALPILATIARPVSRNHAILVGGDDAELLARVGADSEDCAGLWQLDRVERVPTVCRSLEFGDLILLAGTGKPSDDRAVIGNGN